MIIALSTYPDKQSAAKTAFDLVEKELAACVSVVRIEESIYRWKGKIVSDEEYLLIIKTTSKAYPKLEAQIKDTHPHKVPEIIYLEVKGGQKDYLEWVDRNSISKLLRVPLDLSAVKRASEPSMEERRARKPSVLSR
ncbi:MAG TPA: divalent-cation tolerance protein CutA [Candidatus Bilamarchaeum sp.]|nr:divalent-cation tolerance protein CutA [Candidatus Bilamarchaeum sp.]